MEKRLVLYYSRTGSTAKIMNTIGRRLDCEVVRVTDGINYRGPLGYVRACIQALTPGFTKIKDFETKYPMEQYDHIIVGAPIWAEMVCPIAKSLLHEIGTYYEGDVSLVITHMADIPYDKPIAKLDKYLKKPHKYDISISTTKDDQKACIRTFLDYFRS